MQGGVELDVNRMHGTLRLAPAFGKCRETQTGGCSWLKDWIYSKMDKLFAQRTLTHEFRNGYMYHMLKTLEISTWPFCIL